jgi:acyl-CoA thioesterase-1
MNIRKIVLLVALAAGTLAVYWFVRPVHYKNMPPTASGEWVAFGDSLTMGLGADPGHDYPTLLSQRLGIPIQNLGVGGDTTQSALSRMEAALKLQPRVVLLCLGGNDGLQQRPASEMISNLSRMIGAFQQAGSFVVVIGVHSASLRDANASRFKKLAHEHKALYVSDILDGVLGSPSLMSDQIHPNDAGYAAIAERLDTILTPFLPRLKGS